MTLHHTVSILGAGALGAAYASKLYEMDPGCVTFVASGERCQRLKRTGVVVNGTLYLIPVLSPDDDVPPADLIIVALKDQHLDAALPDLAGRVGTHTTILSVMNGLDSEAIIGAMWGAEKLLYAISVGIDAVREGNNVVYGNLGRIVFGEADNTALSPRVQRIQALFERAGIGYSTPPDMIHHMWWKFMVNVGINQPSAVLGAPYGVFHQSEHAQAIMAGAIREVLAVAQAEGVSLTQQDVEDWYAIMKTLRPDGKTSMLQDVEAGRKTEVDIFAGKVIALGAQHGIPTPVNDVLLHALKVLEGNGAG